MKVATTSARSREYDKVVIQRTVKSINDLHKTYTPSTMNKRVIHFNILFIGTPQRGTIPRPDSAKLQNCKKKEENPISSVHASKYYACCFEWNRQLLYLNAEQCIPYNAAHAEFRKQNNRLFQ